jgi:DNA-binding transcriptional regulator YiaG
MDKQEQVVQVRRRRSQAEITELVAAYEASGLSQIEFCRTHGVSLSSLSRYCSRRRQAEAAEVNLLAVELCAQHPSASAVRSGLAVTTAGGRRIEVARGFDAATLVQLLGVLERF